MLLIAAGWPKCKIIPRQLQVLADITGASYRVISGLLYMRTETHRGSEYELTFAVTAFQHFTGAERTPRVLQLRLTSIP